MELQYVLMAIWMLIDLILGITEAFYFSKNQNHVKWKGKNIHFWFTVFRVAVGIPIGLIVAHNIGMLESLLFGSIMVLIFPFFHDGAYYTTIELIKKGTYPLYWLDQSTTTDAKISLNIVTRVLLLIVAILIFPY